MLFLAVFGPTHRARDPVFDDVLGLGLERDADVGKTCGQEHPGDVRGGLGPADSAGKRRRVLEAIRQLGGRDDVGYCEPSTGLQHPEHIRVHL